jgi:predicted DsbA family dithiol-disulfide isomerase
MSYKKALIALEKSKAGASVSDSDRVNIAKDIAGMNTDTLAQCLKDDRYKSSVDRDIAEGDAKRVNATPTLLFDGTKLDLSIFRDAAMLKDQMERILSK